MKGNSQQTNKCVYIIQLVVVSAVDENKCKMGEKDYIEWSGRAWLVKLTYDIKRL